jgi:hypothetical protein
MTLNNKTAYSNEGHTNGSNVIIGGLHNIKETKQFFQNSAAQTNQQIEKTRANYPCDWDKLPKYVQDYLSSLHLSLLGDLQEIAKIDAGQELLSRNR